MPATTATDRHHTSRYQQPQTSSHHHRGRSRSRSPVRTHRRNSSNNNHHHRHHSPSPDGKTHGRSHDSRQSRPRLEDNRESSSRAYNRRSATTSPRRRRSASRSSSSSSSLSSSSSSSSISDDQPSSDRRRHRRSRSKEKHRSSLKRRDRHQQGDSDSGSSDEDEDGEKTRSSKKKKKDKKKKKKKKKKDEDKESKSEKKERKRRRKEKKELKRAKKRSNRGVISEYGKYGIISEADMYTKDQEFRAWLVEEKMLNPETVSQFKMKELFKTYMEDYNTATLPHEKYYALEKYEARMSAIRSGEMTTAIEGYDPRADEEALAAQHKRTSNKTEGQVFIARDQLENLRKIERERVEASRMKRMGMEVKESMGVRYET